MPPAIVPHVWETVVRKNLTIFEGCHFTRFYILIWQSFRKSRQRISTRTQAIFTLVKLGTISFAAYFLNCVHVGRSQTIAAIIRGLSSGKRFLKLKRSFLRLLNYKQEEAVDSCPGEQMLKPIDTTIPPVLLIVFYRLEKVFHTFILYESRMKFISNQFN